MRQGETEGREGALGYSCRRVRSLRRNDTVTANLRVCGSAGENLKTEINSKRKKPWFQGFFSIYEDQIDGITYL